MLCEAMGGRNQGMLLWAKLDTPQVSGSGGQGLLPGTTARMRCSTDSLAARTTAGHLQPRARVPRPAGQDVCR